MPDRPRLFVSRRGRNRTLAWLGVLAVVAALGVLLVRRVAPFLADPESMRAWILGFGPLAPVAFVALQALQVVVAPVPGQVMGVVGGYLFGPVGGTVYAVTGAVLGSTVVFALSRRYGRQFVRGVLAPESLARLDEMVADGGERALFVAFLIPGLPDDALCFVGGLTDVPLPRLVAIAAVGRTPGFLLASLVGAGLAEGRVVQAVLLGGAFLAIAALGYHYRERLARRLTRL